MSFETAGQQWREGLRRLAEVGGRDGSEQRVLDRVSQAIYEELRRRLGSAFSVDELVALYEDGTEWAQRIAMDVAPEHPSAWEPRTVVDAAFGRYVREAADYAGGRRLMTPDG